MILFASMGTIVRYTLQTCPAVLAATLPTLAEVGFLSF